MMYAVVPYANMRRGRVVDSIVELREREIAFIWLTKAQKPEQDAFYDFKNEKLTADVLNDLNYQLLCLPKGGLFALKVLFIAGVKIEANANSYTFVWRQTINYHFIGSLYQKSSVLSEENEYGIKYDIPYAYMFVIEGMDKVRDVIEKNQERKLIKHKKLSNDTIIEINNCSPLEILKLQKNLIQIAEKEQIKFVYGKGKKKPEIQQICEEVEVCVVNSVLKLQESTETAITKRIWKLLL